MHTVLLIYVINLENYNNINNNNNNIFGLNTSI